MSDWMAGIKKELKKTLNPKPLNSNFLQAEREAAGSSPGDRARPRPGFSETRGVGVCRVGKAGLGCFGVWGLV